MESGIFWKTAYAGQTASELTEQEKALRNLFVDEYLIDYNPKKAAIRCGFVEQHAAHYAAQFMEEPYVLKRISEMQSTPVAEEDEENRLRLMRRRIEEGFIQQANYNGPGASHGARVAALSKLANFYGMEQATKVEQEVNHRGGVMAIPAIANLDDWEIQALQSQEKLTGEADK